MNVVQLFKVVLIQLLLVIILSSSLLTCAAQKPVSSLVEVRPGDWGKYTGSVPNEEYEWMLISVLGVKETEVNISLSYDLRPPYRYAQSYQAFRTINVATGRGNIFLFFIPVNLTVGDTIPPSSFYPQLSIEGLDSKEYAGLNRTVTYASSSNMPWGGAGTLYWDKETGLLVEILAKVGNTFFSSLRLIETNIWSISSMDWVMRNSAFIALIVVSMALLIIVSLTFVRRRKRVKWNVKEAQVSWTIIEKSDSPLRRALEFLRYSFCPHLGKVLMGGGFLLFVIGIMNLSVFNQVAFSLSFVFAVIFFVIGVLVRSEAWAGNRFEVDVGVIMISLSVILLSIATVCAVYREIGALVPYKGIVGGVGPIHRAVKEILQIEVVFLYPYAWLISPLATVTLCLAVYGIFFKIRYES